MTYITANYAQQQKPEPLGAIPVPDLETIITTAETNVDTYLVTLGVADVPLTGGDITAEFKKAVTIYAVAEFYYANNNVESGDEWRILAELHLKRFVQTHEFTNTTQEDPSTPEVVKWTDDMTDIQEPRDV